MKTYKTLLEGLPNKTIVFAFGRFNPPHLGHQLVIQRVLQAAKSRACDYNIFVSKTQDKKKNPLNISKKMDYLHLMFPGINFIAMGDGQNTIIDILKNLQKKYNHVIMIAGSDRKQEFGTLLNKYNHVEYNFATIEILSSGERDPDQENDSGLSATKMRNYALNGDVNNFKKGIPSNLRNVDVKRLINDIRIGLGKRAIEEQYDIQRDHLRERYLCHEIFNVGDLVQTITGQTATVVHRGANFIKVQTHHDQQIASKWLYEVVEYTP